MQAGSLMSEREYNLTQIEASPPTPLQKRGEASLQLPGCKCLTQIKQI